MSLSSISLRPALCGRAQLGAAIRPSRVMLALFMPIGRNRISATASW
jgi:hypothetical protein